MDLMTLMEHPAAERSVLELDTYQIFNILRDAGSTLHHYQIRAAVERDFEPGEYTTRHVVSSSADGKSFAVHVLDSDQAAVLTGSFGGSVGVTARRALVETIRNMRAELRLADERIRTLEANQLAVDTLREHWCVIEQRFDDYTQMSIKVQNKHPSKYGDELRYKFDLCYSAVKGVMRNAIAMTTVLPTPSKGETPCPTK